MAGIGREAGFDRAAGLRRGARFGRMAWLTRMAGCGPATGFRHEAGFSGMARRGRTSERRDIIDAKRTGVRRLRAGQLGIGRSRDGPVGHPVSAVCCGPFGITHQRSR